MEINVMLVPEREYFLLDILINDKIWISKNLGEPKLSEKNAKYIAPFWLGDKKDRGVNRIFYILKMTVLEDDNVYEISLGNSFYLSENWIGKVSQFRRFQYVPLSEFKLREISEGILVPSTDIAKTEKGMSREDINEESETTAISREYEKPINTEDKFFNEFWIGEDIKLNKYWRAYYQGGGYIEKFKKSECFIFEISFLNKPKELPLFNFEPVSKTLKAFYFYAKKTYLPESEFESEGPLYLQEVSRGSEILTLLGGGFITIFAIILSVVKLKLLRAKLEGQQSDNLLTKSKLTGQDLENNLKEEKIEGEKIENLNKKLNLLKEHYPDIYVLAEKNEPPKELKEALLNLIGEGVHKIRFSKNSINNLGIDKAKDEMEELDF